MDGRTEHKIITEKKIIEKINKYPEYYLLGFYNSLGQKYEYKTKEVYINHVLLFLSYLNKNIIQIDEDDLNVYFTKLQYKEKNKKTVETSGTYRATVHSALKQYFNYLYKTKKIINNPMENIERPKNKKDSNIERIYLTPDEMQKIIENIKVDGGKNTNRDSLILMIFLYTGIRCTALTEINIEDIDFKNYILKIVDKRDKYREFPIPKEMMILINKVRGTRTTGALFISNRNTRISQSNIKWLLKKYTNNIDKHVTPHKLRHSYGTNLYNETGDIYAVKNAMGHENISTTQIYVHVDKKESGRIGMEAMKKNVVFSI